jgi:hypothetical protein
VDDKDWTMTVFSVWAGVTFLGVFSSIEIVNEVYGEFEMANGAEFTGDLIVFETTLDEVYQ